MTILLPIKIRSTGGTSTFARKFQEGMHRRGHRVVFSYTADYDILLASPRAPLWYLLDAKLRRKRIVHRLDGVYYPGTAAGRAWRLHNLPLRLIRNYFADFIVYQSRFSQDSCNAFLGATDTPSTIIYNGVDTKHFSPTGSTENLRDNPDQHVFITASRFRRPDQIIPLLDAFTAYCNDFHKNSKLVVIGNFTGSVATVPTKRTATNIHFLGVVPNEKLPNYLRAADVFLFTHRNPPCPNNVIEAMACGLPICGIADGAMPELIANHHEGELILVSDELFLKPRSFNMLEFSQNMHLIMQNKPRYYQQAATRIQNHFTLEKMINTYLHYIKLYE